jgi:guanylate kinase
MSNKSPGSGHLFIISAPSGGGKTSLVNALLQQDSRLVMSVSHTTRTPRPGEVDGKHYHFVSEPLFKTMIDEGDFLEHALVFDHYYGTNRHSVKQQLEMNRDVILEIDWQGARQVKMTFNRSCSIFIIPPSLETLRERLTRRGQDSEKIIQRRMRDAQAEISHWQEFDHLVVNDNFSKALDELQQIIQDFRQQRAHAVNQQNQRLAEQLGKR